MPQGTTSKPYFFSWPLNPEQVDQLEQTFQKVFQALNAQNRYNATAFSNALTVTIQHGFGVYPVVQVIDANGLVTAPATITHISTSVVTVTFSTSTSGTIICSA